MLPPPFWRGWATHIWVRFVFRDGRSHLWVGRHGRRSSPVRVPGDVEAVMRNVRAHSADFSRSKAKRLVATVDLYKTVLFDFQGVETIGPAFADEVSLGIRSWRHLSTPGSRRFS